MLIRVCLALVFLISNLLVAAKAQGVKKPTKKQLGFVHAYHIKHSDCDQKIQELTIDDVMMVEETTAIVSVLCITGAYQGSSVFYQFDTDGQEPYVSLVSFVGTSDGKKFFGETGLTEGEFDRKTKTIQSYYKSRGAGDCGGTAKYKWHKYGFYLVEAGYMPCCSRHGEAEENKECKRFKKLRDESEEQFPIIYRFRDK